MKKFKLALVGAALSLLITGCDNLGGPITMKSDEVGVVNRKLPVWLGGGITDKIARQGSLEILFPWDDIVILKSSIQEVTWEFEGRLDPEKHTEGVDYLETRARDGNKLALEVVVRYKISDQADKLINLVQHVGYTDEQIRDLMINIAKADIRFATNKLNTADFTKSKKIVKAQKEARTLMSERLEDRGVEVTLVKIKDFHFNKAYQDMLDDIQRTREDIQQEKAKILTAKADMQYQVNVASAKQKRKVEEAKGKKARLELQAAAYLEEKRDLAAGIRAKGEAEVQGMLALIDALSGEGAESLLKLELARSLIKANPSFVILNNGQDGSGQSLDVRKVDTNQLLSQLGLIEGMKEPKPLEGPASEQTGISLKKE